MNNLDAQVWKCNIVDILIRFQVIVKYELNT